MTKTAFKAHEVRNPSFSDMNIDQQIEAGVNDWVACDYDGREFYGQSSQEATDGAKRYNFGCTSL